MDIKLRKIALCHCGTPLVSTLEVSFKEWYCVTCEAFFDWLHAQEGTGPNPTPELDAAYKAAEKKYDAERAARREAAKAASETPVISCENTQPHKEHFWDHFNIDYNRHDHVKCSGLFLLVD